MQTFYYHPLSTPERIKWRHTGGVAQARFEMTESTVQWAQDYIHTVLCGWNPQDPGTFSETERDAFAHRSATKRPPLLPILYCVDGKTSEKKRDTPLPPLLFNRSNACYIMIKERKMCTFHQWVTTKQGFRMAAWWCRKSKSQTPQWMTHNKANHSSMMTDDKVYDASTGNKWPSPSYLKRTHMTKSTMPQLMAHDKVHKVSTVWKLNIFPTPVCCGIDYSLQYMPVLL